MFALLTLLCLYTGYLRIANKDRKRDIELSDEHTLTNKVYTHNMEKLSLKNNKIMHMYRSNEIHNGGQKQSGILKD